MQDYHTIPFDLNAGNKSQGFFAYEDPDTLVIFVHGFKGSAIGTWNDFPEAIVNNAAFSKSDFIFYGYSTLKASTTFHSSEFEEFLEKSIKPRKNNIFSDSQGLNEREYSKVILVAHSLGALIVRQALVTACKKNHDWVDKISLLLFAPAHTGARVQSLVREILTGMIGIIPSLTKYRYPVYEDLETGSIFLTNLIEETKRLLPDKKFQCNIAKKVICGERDRVVSQVKFCDDPDPERVYHKGHINICKPNEVYVKPVELLLDVIIN